jgi:ABC-type glycerol-3-phosphate transport system substrate-binding protein
MSVKNLTAGMLLTGVAALAACNQQGSKTSTTTTSDTTISSTTTKTTYSVPAATGFQKTVDGKSTDLYYLKIKMVYKLLSPALAAG